MKISFKQILHQLLQDKDGNFSLREAIALVYVLMSIVAWISQQFFGQAIPEFMFYSFMSMIGASAFGYSLEKKSDPKE
jgi:ABC-type uncharacterized transport system permease subunit